MLVIVYWPVWDVWFRADDFAWLGLRHPVRDAPTLMKALFQPMAQGTVRFLSERAFFLVFSSIFGNDPVPMRAFVFALQVANIALLGRLTWRLSGSWAAAALVPSLWLLNPGVAASLAWLSTWNQLLVVFFLLGALVSFMERRPWLCWTSFLLGFGALEVNIVFPALLLVYVWLYERDRLREVWPFFAPALIFVGLHLFVIPKNKLDPTYQLFLDADLPRRLSRYWKWGLGFWRYVAFFEVTVAWERVGSPVLTALGLGAVGWGLRNLWLRRSAGRLALFGLAWFVGLLLPVLPLKNHFSDYYLASASVGMAMILGVAVVEAWKWHRVAGFAASVSLAAMSFVSFEVHGATVGWYRSHSEATRRLVRGVVEARRLHPNDVILVDGVDNSLFWDGVMDDPFRTYLVFDVFLTPGSERRLVKSMGGEEFAPYIFPEQDTRFLLEQEAVQVYRAGEGPLRNVTRRYYSEQDGVLASGAPRFLNVAKPAYEGLLGAGWHPVNNRARWTEGRAEFRIGGPSKPGQSLWMTGYVAESVVAEGPQELTVTVNRQKLPPVRFVDGNAPFEVAVPLPEGVNGAPELKVEFEFSRRPKIGGREHALIFQRLTVR